ncbi:hypothetical protein Tco_1090304 [Tanacetum coccineum]|uniref:Uncharacterized protein n=1 Tax=Tanacetum coccineum TaxID=301880 RepID=A0ABQ5I3T5_9ASTR
MPTEMELTLEQTQQGVSYEVSNIRVNSFIMKMEILLEPTSNKLMVGLFKDVVRSLIPTGSQDPYPHAPYPTYKHKDIMKALKVHVQDSATRDTNTSFSMWWWMGSKFKVKRISRRCKQLKLSKSTNQEVYMLAKVQVYKRQSYKMAKRMCLVDDSR